MNDIKPAQIVSLETVRGKEKILRAPAVLRRIDPMPSKATFWRWVKQGTLPQPFMFAGRAAWLESQIEAFIKSRVPESGDPEQGPPSSNAA